MTKQLKALKERVKKGDASAEDEMYEVEEQLDKANAILKKEKEAAKKEKEVTTRARIKLPLVKNYQVHPTHWLIYAQAAKALAKAAKKKGKK